MIVENGHRFRQVLRKRREDLGMTQQSVAKAIGVNSAGFVGMIEAGSRRLDLNRIPRLADVLQLSRKDLIRAALYEEAPTVSQILFGAELPEKIHTIKVNDQEIEITPEMVDPLIKLLSLTPQQRQTCVNMINYLYNAAHQTKA